MLATLLAVVSIAASAPVTAIAADGGRVAFAAGCEVRLWTPPARTTLRLGRNACPRTSTGSGIGGVSLAGSRVLWLHYAGGNVREWALWTATATSRPRRLRFVARDVDGPPPIVLGSGDDSRLGSLLPYAVDREVVALRANGSRAFAWRAPARVVALDANAGELAVATEAGDVFVLDASGGVLRTAPTRPAVRTVRITGASLLVLHGRTLDLPAGATFPEWQIHGIAAVPDAHGTLALYASPNAVYALGLDTRRSVVLARKSLPAQLEAPGLYVANARRVTFTPIRDLLRRLR